MQCHADKGENLWAVSARLTPFLSFSSSSALVFRSFLAQVAHCGISFKMILPSWSQLCFLALFPVLAYTLPYSSNEVTDSRGGIVLPVHRRRDTGILGKRGIVGSTGLGDTADLYVLIFNRGFPKLTRRKYLYGILTTWRHLYSIQPRQVSQPSTRL